MSSTTFPNGQTLVSSALTPPEIEMLFQPLVASILGLDPATDPAAAYSAVRCAWQKQGQPAWTVDQDICVLAATLKDEPFARMRDNYYSPNSSISLTSRMGFTQVWNLHCTLYGPNCADRARLILSAMTLDWVHDWTVSPISSASIGSAAGLGYHQGDIVSVTATGAQGGRLTVTSVDANGAVTGIATIGTARGIGYTVANDLPTTGGQGTGLTVNVVSTALYLVVGPERPTYAPENFQGQWWQRADIDLEFNEAVTEAILVSSAAGVDVTLLKETGLSAEFTIPPNLNN